MIKTHGMSGTRPYRNWAAMRNRCNNPHDEGYKNYGGRGIKVCPEWQTFESFWNWALFNGYKDGLTIERIDVNGDYCPENCTWIEKQYQPRNTRRNIFVEYNGETKCLKDWCRELSLPYDNIHDRISKGWSANEAFQTPVISIGHRDWSQIKKKCVDAGIKFSVVRKRIASGWTEERALSEPVYGKSTIELREKCKAAGVKYETVKYRMAKLGWSEERALSDSAQNHTLRAKCEKHGISYFVVANRIYQLGWPEERALNTPTLGKGANQTSY